MITYFLRRGRTIVAPEPPCRWFKAQIRFGEWSGVENRTALRENQSWSQPMQRALLLLYRQTGRG